MIPTNPDHGTLQRDERDEWPADAPVGTFDIEIAAKGILGYPGASGHILFVCPNGKRCGALIGPSPVTRQHPDGLSIWGWDGNIEQPTLTPSLDCRAEKDGKPTGGCGWHGFITQGRFK